MLVLLSFAKSFSVVAQTAVQRDFNSHFSCCSSTEAVTWERVWRGTAIVLRTAIDVGQRQGPGWAAQLFLTALGDAGRATEQLQILLLHGLLQVHVLKLDGHAVDSRIVEDFSNFHTGVLIAPVFLILDVQGGDDLSTYQFPDVHFVYTANPWHGRELTH